MIRMFRPKDRPKQARLIRQHVPGLIKARKMMRKEHQTSRYGWIGETLIPDINIRENIIQEYWIKEVHRRSFSTLFEAYHHATSILEPDTLTSISISFSSGLTRGMYQVIQFTLKEY